jgi:hypothetical protein
MPLRVDLPVEDPLVRRGRKNARVISGRRSTSCSLTRRVLQIRATSWMVAPPEGSF